MCLLDYIRTIGQMIVSILNSFAQKSLELTEKTLTRFVVLTSRDVLHRFDGLSRMDSLPEDVETFQKRMSFSATDTPALLTLQENANSSNKATLDKLKNFGSRFSSMVTRQAAPTFNKLTSQGDCFLDQRETKKKHRG